MSVKVRVSDACLDSVHSDCMDESWCACPCHAANTCPPHQPHHLGMIIQGPGPSGLVLDRVHLRLCVKCYLAYWEELPSVSPSVIAGGGRQN